MKKTNSINISAIILYVLLGLSALHFIFLMLGLFGVVTPECLEREHFNYIVAFVLLALVIIFYALFVWLETKKNLVVPTWFKIVLYVGLYIFTNIYFYFGLYEHIGLTIIAYIFFAFIFNIFALGLYFNSEKNDNGYIKTSDKFPCFKTFAIAMTFGVIFELVISTLKLLLLEGTKFATLSHTIISLSTLMLTSLLMAIMFMISLSKSKRFINGCLIKVYKK